MKNKIFKITCVVIVICMIASIFVPFSVKSSQTTLTNMEDTGRGVGGHSVWRTTIKGYGNSYCVKGGSSLYTGAQLNDKGSIYTNSFTDITSEVSAVRWLLDNMYLLDGADNTQKSEMKSNMKSIMKEYAAKKNAQGKSWLAGSLGMDSISDDWINKAVDAVISDTNTLYAVQQYALWNYVNNANSAYKNALQNSDGSYSKIPNAKIDKNYYIGYYVVLREMAKSAQKNNYVSPNTSGKFDISLENNSAKVSLQSDKKSVLMGPYTLKNNHEQVKKTLTATVNSENCNSIQAVNEKGQAIDLQNYTGKLYFKITYNKGFSKGVTYKIKVNVALKGYKTFANILYPSGYSKQPVVSIRREAYTKNLSNELNYYDEITGKYSLEILKIGDDNKALSGTKFKVKQTGQAEKEYGPSNNNGIVSVINNKEIKKAEQVSYIITEIQTKDNTYALLADPFQINIQLGVQNEQYKPLKVTFTNGTTKKEMKLKNGTQVTLVASISGNTVRVTVPNKKITGNYSLDIIKKDQDGKNISGVTFGVQDGSNAIKTYGPTGNNGTVNIVNKTITSAGIDEYTITEVKAKDNYITLKDSVKVYVTKEIKNYKFEVTKVSFEKDKEVKTKQVELKDGSKVNININLTNNKVSVTIPNKKIEGNYSLDILKVDENNKPLAGVNFKIASNSDAIKTYGPTNETGIINVVNNKDITDTNVDEYTIKEVSSKNNQYITLKDELKLYVKKEIKNYKYVVSSVSFDSKNVVTTKNVLLKNNENVSVSAKLQNNKITITVPNKKIEGSYSLDIKKVDSVSLKALSGASFTVKEGNQNAKTYGPSDNQGNVAIVTNKNITETGIDEYTISEVKINKDYITLKDSFKIYVTKEIQNYKYVASKVSFEKTSEVKSKQVTLKDGTKAIVRANLQNGKILITVPNKPIKGTYSLELEKVNSENSSEKLAGVTFKVKDGSNGEKVYGPTGEDGKVTVLESKNITEVGIDEYTISEIKLNNEDFVELKNNIKREGFITIKDSFKVYVTKEIKDNNYVASKVSFEKDAQKATKKVALEDGTNVTLKAEIIGNNVKITIPNKPNTKRLNFDLALRKSITKVTRNGKEVSIGESRTPVINDFSVKEYEETKTAGYYHTKTPVTVKPGDTVLYTLRVYNEGDIEGYAKEITDYLPAGLEYIENSQINKLNNWIAVKNEDGTTTVKTNVLTDAVIKPANGVEGFESFAKLSSKKNPEFCKYVEIECKIKSNMQDKKLLVNVAEITNYGYLDDNKQYVQANKKNVDIDSTQNNVFSKKDNIKNIDEYYDNIVVPQYKDNNKNYKGLEDDDDFENVYVEPDELKFKFVLNKVDEEGNPLIGADFTVERQKDDENKVLLDNEEVKGTYEVIENNVRFNKTYSYKVLEVESAPEYVNVMNGKYITLRTYLNEDRKLILGNYEKVEEEDSLITKYGFIINNIDGSIIKENETDLYEKIKVEVKNNVEPAQVVITIPNKKIEKQLNFDLALRKYITKVTRNGKEVSIGENRTPVINDFSVKEYEETKTAGYYHTKTPVAVKPGDIVLYTLRVYNEGDTEGYAKEITDYLPQGLEYIAESDINIENQWSAATNEDGTTTVKTAKLVGNVIKPANGVEGFASFASLSGKSKPEFSKDVQIECRVNKNIQNAKLLVNVAEITAYGYINNNGEYIEANEQKVDIDSEQNNVFSINEDVKNINQYYEEVVVPQIKELNKNYKGIQDDDDFENIYVEPNNFDLALRKFITSVTKHVGTAEQKEVAIINRIPTFKIDEKGNYVYEHTKEPVVVANGNIVTYTLRVYNEGNVDGYAKLIKDDIPVGLEFLPEEPINKVFRWIMLDENGKETKDVKNAVYVASDYLSKEQEKEVGENLIRAFDVESYNNGKIKQPNYKEVKVAFKVNKKDKFDEIVINQAQISKHSEKDGNDIKDIDSTPDKWIDGEDDQDIEKVKVQYFDLSLRKWVTKAITIENGVQTVSETGHKAEDDPEQIVKVDLKDSKIKDVTVKFEYKIRVKNEGQIAGFAKEISDYIPQGLKFVKEDNPDWNELEGKVVTEKLKDTLLKPGETAEVTILLTWINDSKNMGLKVNTAEISKDYNEDGSPDIDSIPNNKVAGEDDIDDAPVMLTVKTGQESTYIAVVGAVVVLIASGSILIKKFVL